MSGKIVLKYVYIAFNLFRVRDLFTLHRLTPVIFKQYAAYIMNKKQTIFLSAAQ